MCKEPISFEIKFSEKINCKYNFFYNYDIIPVILLLFVINGQCYDAIMF